MYRRSIVCIIFIINVLAVIGQKPEIIPPTVLLRSENSAYFKLHSQGWGIGYRSGTNKTALQQRTLEVGFYTMKHPKEIKISNSFNFLNAKSYIYGKMNYFFLLQGSLGSQKTLNEKPYWGGVDVRLYYALGPVLGFTKPVYLYIIPDKTLEKYNPDLHFYDNIYGRGPFFKGFDEIKLHPGAYVKAGINFEHGSENTRVRALEAGIMLSAFVKPIEIMSFTRNYNIFLNLYISYHLGGRK